jgi:hypothetical protein
MRPEEADAVVVVVPGEDRDGFIASTPGADFVASHETERDGLYSVFLIPR